MKLRSLYPVPLFLGSALLSLHPLLGDPQQILLWRGGAFSDLLISHWPHAAFVRGAIETWGQLPLWNPTILSGIPLAADPLAGIWYPPTWLAILLPHALGFNLLIWLHLTWAGIGSWRLSRRLGMGHAAAIIAGLAFAATPKLLGHVGLGHVGLLSAVSWTPWALLAADGAARMLGQPLRRRLAAGAAAGALIGLAFLADPRWYPGLVVLTVAFTLWRAAPATGWKLRVSTIAVTGAISLAVAAVLALPLAEFFGLSTRFGLELQESNNLSLPPERLLGMLAPELGGWPEWQPYFGAVVLYLAGLAIVASARGAGFWLALVVISLVVAVGDATPAYGVLRAVLPGFSQLRVPPRSLLFAAFGMAMLAGLGFDRLRGLDKRRIRLLAGSLFVLCAIFGGANWGASSGNPPQERAIRVIPWAMSAAFIGIAGGLTGSAAGKRFSPGAFATFLAAVLLVDLGLVNLTTLKAQAVVPDPMAELLVQSIRPGQRVFSPSYSVSQPSAAELGLETADGVNPLQLASYREFMQSAIGIRDRGYSVTLPPFPSGSVSEPWGFEPDSERLGLLAVSAVVTAYPVDATGLELIEVEYRRFVYRNSAARPRAWVEGPAGLVPAAELVWSPNSIELKASGEGRLVLSEIAYPGWTASVDGAEAPILTYANLLRSVELPAGPHSIAFEFRPISVYAGAVLTVLGLLATASLWVRR